VSAPKASQLKRRGDNCPVSFYIPGNQNARYGRGWQQETAFLQPLPTQFRRDGFDCQQIAREGDAVIYEQRWVGCSNASLCYEVIRIRRREGFQIDGRFVEPAEVYPNSDAWGVDGFTLTDKYAAFAKLKEVANERK